MPYARRGGLPLRCLEPFCPAELVVNGIASVRRDWGARKPGDRAGRRVADWLLALPNFRAITDRWLARWRGIVPTIDRVFFGG